MDGRLTTDTTSFAYQQISKMKIDKGIYKEGKYVGIAISNNYGKIGDKFRITLSSGQVFYAVMCETKKSHELDENYAHPDGSIIEFVVDTKALSHQVKEDGSLNCIYQGSITKLERME